MVMHSLSACRLLCAGGSVRYQPVMMERSSLIGPAARIISDVDDEEGDEQQP